jgi:hypothetical protein
MMLDKKTLYDLGFIKPNIVSYKKNDFEILEKDENFFLKNKNLRWMAFEKNHREVFEVYSHFVLAEGHCVCTGMGFLLRESWLLNNKNVSKITVIEKNKDLIDYHYQFNRDIMNKIEIINMDVYEYKGTCDTLLVDHFEGGHILFPSFLRGFNVVCNNITNERSWMWPMEAILDSCYRDYVGLSLYELYSNIKKYFDLKTLPDLTEKQLFHFCQVFFMGNFAKCDFTKIRS